MGIWSTLFVESWKRKQAWLANRWMVRDFNQVSFARKEFKASYIFDDDLVDKEMQPTRNWYKRWYS
jgi:hypothetical protein